MESPRDQLELLGRDEALLPPGRGDDLSGVRVKVVDLGGS